MREVDYGDRKPLLKFISKEIKMTKYIDRYYLNWELYGIKFGWGWRQPWANTLVYYNISDNDTNSTIYDLSWNGYDQTWYWIPWYTTDATYGRTASFDGSSYTIASSRVNFWDEVTFIALCNFDTQINSRPRVIVSQWQGSSSWGTWIWEWIFWTWWMYVTFPAWLTQNDIDSWVNPTLNTRYMIAWTRASDGTWKIYINWVLKNTVSWLTIPTYNVWTNLTIWQRWGNSNYFHWLFKLFIWENRCWTDAEIAALAQEYWFTN